MNLLSRLFRCVRQYEAVFETAHYGDPFVFAGQPYYARGVAEIYSFGAWSEAQALRIVSDWSKSASGGGVVWYCVKLCDVTNGIIREIQLDTADKL